MTRSASPKLAAYAAVSAIGLLAALVTGRPELVALTAPFLLALGLGLALLVTLMSVAFYNDIARLVAS